MTRTWTWVAILLSALAMVASAPGERMSFAGSADAGISHRPAPSESSPSEDLDSSQHFRLRRVDHLTRLQPRVQRVARDGRRKPWQADPMIAAASATALLPTSESSPACPHADAAQRNGTCSAHSTGLPPPSV